MKNVTLIALGLAIGWIALWALSINNGDSAFENSQAQISEPLPALVKPRLVVKKSKRELIVYDDDKLIKTYRIALGFAPVGDKEKQGDGRTPEGDYKIAVKNPKSKFYLSLGINYPNQKDAARGLRDKQISPAEYDQIILALKENRLPLQNTKMGGEIYLHGGGNGKDWTWGCIGFENDEIKELFDALPLQTPITIEP